MPVLAGGNKAINRELIKRVGLPEETSLEFPFVASTMFWARPDIFKPLIQADFHADEFPAEPLPADSTLAHALERFFGLLTVQQGYRIKAVDSNGVFSEPEPFAIYQFTPAPKALALADVKSLVYYPAYEEAYGIEHLRITAPITQQALGYFGQSRWYRRPRNGFCSVMRLYFSEFSKHRTL